MGFVRIFFQAFLADAGASDYQRRPSFLGLRRSYGGSDLFTIMTVYLLHVPAVG